MSDRYVVVHPPTKVYKNGRCNSVPPAFKKNFARFIKLMHKVAKASGKRPLWKLDNIELTDIYSTEKSSMQQLFYIAGDWDQFDMAQKE
jgi:hypothetical protein